jgi:hypothetical protein
MPRKVSLSDGYDRLVFGLFIRIFCLSVRFFGHTTSKISPYDSLAKWPKIANHIAAIATERFYGGVYSGSIKFDIFAFHNNRIFL